MGDAVERSERMRNLVAPSAPTAASRRWPNWRCRRRSPGVGARHARGRGDAGGAGQAVGAHAPLRCAQRSDRWGRDDDRIGVAGDDRRGWGARHARGRGDAGGAGSQLRATRFFRRHRPYACNAPKGLGVILRPSEEEEVYVLTSFNAPKGLGVILSLLTAQGQADARQGFNAPKGLGVILSLRRANMNAFWTSIVSMPRRAWV